MKRKLIDLSNQRTQLLKDAEAALEAGSTADYDAAMEKVTNLNTEIQRIQNLLAEQERHIAEQQPATAGLSGGHDNAPVVDRVACMRGSNEYTRAFCSAVRNRLSPASARGYEGYGILLDALTENGGTTPGEDGGFLVPVDLQTRINELRRQMVSLRALVRVEPVTTLTGYRVLDTAPTKGFTALEEMGQIPTDDQPAFSRYEYKVKDYGLIIPISNDLLADNDAGLLEYLARWMAKKAVLTENALILNLLATAQATTVKTGQELAAIKKALNVTLDPDIALNAVILANQTAYDLLDNLVDGNGRPLLQPDVTGGSGQQLKGRPIQVVANRLLADSENGSPVYIGDFAEAITIFDRQVMEFTTTNVGGSAWRTNSTEGRAIMRLDVQQVDKDAVAALTLSGKE